MFGALLTLAVCGALAVPGAVFIGKWAPALDRAARWGIGGLAGLGVLGLMAFVIALLPDGFSPPLAYILIFGMGGGYYSLYSKGARLRVSKPQGVEWAFVAGLVLCGLIALVSVLAPADTLEWDSLAYHLAVPKLWLAAGRMYYIPFIHHSNFPFIFDNLYLFGLTWGGQPGAKAFVLAAGFFGVLAIFGLARQVYGRRAAWWAALTFATVPVVLWLSGTAYIDVPNGLSAGLAIALTALFLQTEDRRYLWLAGIMLGLAIGSKYTGLQTLFAIGVVVIAVGIKRRRLGSYLKPALLAGALALAIASPWYIKNILWTGNPVYPFFYSVFGGKNWSKEQTVPYSNEQQTFGVGRTTGRRDVSQLGHAILGLGYQPGRFINPNQEQGGGFPYGAVGLPILGAMLAWSFSGRARSFELACLAVVGISLFMWFFLSQQSRYIVTLTIPLSILLGGGIARLRAGPWLAAVAAVQAVYSGWLLAVARSADQFPVALGLVTKERYLSSHVPFYEAAEGINQLVPKEGRVALYDEVFGYLLDEPYFWANPGHSNVIDYASFADGRAFAAEMKRLGFSHVYISFSAHSAEQNMEWLGAMGLDGPPRPLPPARREELMQSFEQRYVPLIAEAVASGKLQPVQGFRTGILFQLR